MLASRRVVIGPPGLGTSTGRAALRPTPDNSEMTATPTTMLMMAVKTLLASGAGWVNGAAAAITSARAVIQAKNAKGRPRPSPPAGSSMRWPTRWSARPRRRRSSRSGVLLGLHPDHRRRGAGPPSRGPGTPAGCRRRSPRSSGSCRTTSPGCGRRRRPATAYRQARRGADRSRGAVRLDRGGRGAGGTDRPAGSQARGAAPPAWPRELTVKVIIYGDFNCLYCHLASQRADRLVRAGTANVEWRAVEHRPPTATSTPAPTACAAWPKSWARPPSAGGPLRGCRG